MHSPKFVGSRKSIGIFKYFAKKIGYLWEITVDSTQLKIHKCKPVSQKCRCTIVCEKHIIKNYSPNKCFYYFTRILVPNLPDITHENRVIRQSIQK